MSKLFQKKVENFVCEHCGAEVVGDGYTNHCPKCLWSKHVDVNPGDRAEKCGGMMRPAGILIKKGEHLITHCCIKCGFTRRKRIEREDNFDEAVKISAERNK